MRVRGALRKLVGVQHRASVRLQRPGARRELHLLGLAVVVAAAADLADLGVGRQQAAEQPDQVAQPVAVAVVARRAQRVRVRKVDHAERGRRRRRAVGGRLGAVVHAEDRRAEELPARRRLEAVQQPLQPVDKVRDRRRAQHAADGEAAAQRGRHLLRPQRLAPRLAAPLKGRAAGGADGLRADEPQPERPRRRRAVLAQVAQPLLPAGVGRDRARADLDVDDARRAHAVRDVLEHDARAAADAARAEEGRDEGRQRVVGPQLLVERVLARKVAVAHRLRQPPGLRHEQRAALVREARVAADLVRVLGGKISSSCSGKFSSKCARAAAVGAAAGGSIPTASRLAWRSFFCTSRRELSRKRQVEEELLLLLVVADLVSAILC